jgi:hypothetical protein
MNNNKRRKVDSSSNSNSSNNNKNNNKNNNNNNMASMVLNANRIGIFKSRTPITPLGLVYNKATTKFTENALVLECFVDFCCPFSKKIWDRLTKDVYGHYNNNSTSPLKIIFHQVPQPWHPQSTLLHEVALASLIAGGDDKYQLMYQNLFDIRDKFTDMMTYDMTRTQIYESLALATSTNVGIEAKNLMTLLALDTSNGQKNSGNATTQALKWYVKQHRQRGIHVSPTCAINGVEVNTSSGWSLDEWRKLLDPLIEGAGSC